MFARRFGGGLAAASFALVLFLGAAPAAATGVALGEVPWWAAAPGTGVVPGQANRVLPRGLADSREPWRAAQHYRWRPIEVPCGSPPPPTAAWIPAHAPPPLFAMPAPVGELPRGGVAPPRVANWRAPGPTIVTVHGVPYRFRPAGPWRAPMMAQVPPVPGPGGYPAYSLGQPPQPVLGPQWPAPPVAFVRTAAAPPGAGVQPPSLSPGDAWFGYRFRPDARFASYGSSSGSPGLWLGPPRVTGSRARASGGELGAMPAHAMDPRPVSWPAVAYLYD